MHIFKIKINKENLTFKQISVAIIKSGDSFYLCQGTLSNLEPSMVPPEDQVMEHFWLIHLRCKNMKKSLNILHSIGNIRLPPEH